eukprot:COSAG02_NODE_22488_length_750_cov_9.039939_1_plen_31_part_10
MNQRSGGTNKLTLFSGVPERTTRNRKHNKSW